MPSQLRPALALVRGAGERVEPLPEPAPHAAVLLPGGGGLATADVFAEADRLGARPRRADELEALAVRLRRGGRRRRLAALLRGAARQRPRARRPARCDPTIGDALEALRDAGAPVALLSGSGPTAVGLFADLAAARAAAAAIDRDDAIVCEAGS